MPLQCGRLEFAAHERGPLTMAGLAAARRSSMWRLVVWCCIAAPGLAAAYVGAPLPCVPAPPLRRVAPVRVASLETPRAQARRAPGENARARLSARRMVPPAAESGGEEGIYEAESMLLGTCVCVCAVFPAVAPAPLHRLTRVPGAQRRSSRFRTLATWKTSGCLSRCVNIACGSARARCVRMRNVRAHAAACCPHAPCRPCACMMTWRPCLFPDAQDSQRGAHRLA